VDHLVKKVFFFSEIKLHRLVTKNGTPHDFVTVALYQA